MEALLAVAVACVVFSMYVRDIPIVGQIAALAELSIAVFALAVYALVRWG